ncbi:putative inner membrane protein [mine drainage metagenome]|uniref:Putative inner membrane protein n=1 Tax=mine drainage metagenome TaxID=410659 RepID=A0A1J5QZA9_9ZZZZ
MLALLAALGVLPLTPFAVPIVAALALAAASLPLQLRLERRLPPWLAASLVTALWTIAALLPLLAIYLLLAPALPTLRQASVNPDEWLKTAQQLPLVGPLLAAHQDAVRAWIAANRPQALLAAHAGELRAIGAHLLQLMLHAALALAVLWGVLASHRSIAQALQHSLRRVVSVALAQRIEHHVLRSTQAVIIGMAGLAAWDGLLSLPLFIAAGLGGAFAWSIAMALLSVLPGGTGVVMVLAAALLGSQGHIGAALTVLGVGHAITLSGDVFVKPKLTGAAGHAPFLLVLLAIFGGVEAFGMLGLILGPVLVLTAHALLFDE